MEGWFRTGTGSVFRRGVGFQGITDASYETILGDIGYVSSNGHVYVVDRLKGMSYLDAFSLYCLQICCWFCL